VSALDWLRRRRSGATHPPGRRSVALGAELGRRSGFALEALRVRAERGVLRLEEISGPESAA
jgi:hypothetical protein